MVPSRRTAFLQADGAGAPARGAVGRRPAALRALVPAEGAGFSAVWATGGDRLEV
jgi:hypothetical protein